VRSKWDSKASDSERLEVAEFLIQKGAIVTCPGLDGGQCSGDHLETPLVLAIQYKQSGLIELFLRYEARFCPLALNCALTWSNDETVKRIIESGVDVNTKNGIG
jgi:hypothetical protein